MEQREGVLTEKEVKDALNKRETKQQLIVFKTFWLEIPVLLSFKKGFFS